MAALHYGDLALVQPILATELLFVFAYMAVDRDAPAWRATTGWPPRPWRRGSASSSSPPAPRAGTSTRQAASWWFAGISALGLALVATVVAFTPMRRGSAAVAGAKGGDTRGGHGDLVGIRGRGDQGAQLAHRARASASS